MSPSRADAQQTLLRRANRKGFVASSSAIVDSVDGVVSAAMRAVIASLLGNAYAANFRFEAVYSRLLASERVSSSACDARVRAHHRYGDAIFSLARRSDRVTC